MKKLIKFSAILPILLAGCGTVFEDPDPEDYGPRDYFGGRHMGVRSGKHYVSKELRGTPEERAYPGTESEDADGVDYVK